MKLFPMSLSCSARQQLRTGRTREFQLWLHPNLSHSFTAQAKWWGSHDMSHQAVCLPITRLQLLGHKEAVKWEFLIKNNPPSHKPLPGDTSIQATSLIPTCWEQLGCQVEELVGDREVQPSLCAWDYQSLQWSLAVQAPEQQSWKQALQQREKEMRN